MLRVLPVCLCALIVLWSGSGFRLSSIHTHTRSSLHIAIPVQVPQEEGTFFTFSERGGEGGDSRGEEGLTFVNRSLLYLPCSISCSVYLITCIQIVSHSRLATRNCTVSFLKTEKKCSHGLNPLNIELRLISGEHGQQVNNESALKKKRS